MTCRTDRCCQGRTPCPTPEVCTDEFTADEAFTAFMLAAGWLAVAFLAITAWLVYSVAPVLIAVI